jgi:hypothetical protein
MSSEKGVEWVSMASTEGRRLREKLARKMRGGTQS